MTVYKGCGNSCGLFSYKQLFIGKNSQIAFIVT